MTWYCRLDRVGLVTMFVLTAAGGLAYAQWVPDPIAVPLLGTQGAAAPYGSSVVATPPGGPNATGTFTVTLYQVTHPCAQDLAVLLVHNTTEKYLLMSRAGGCAPLQGTTVSISNVVTSPGPLPETPPATPYGDYLRVRASNYGAEPAFPAPAPAGPYTKGFPPSPVNLNGTWTLYVVDTAAGNRGVIAGGWSFQYSPNVIATSQQTSVRVPAVDTGPGLAAAYPVTFDLSAALPDVTVSRLVLDVFIQHSYPDDLRMLLQSPAGTPVILMANAGGPIGFNGRITFDDLAGDFVPDAGPIMPNAFYRPGSGYPTPDIALTAPAPTSGYRMTFSALNGEPIRGIWKLWLIDDSPMDSGTLDHAVLTIRTETHSATFTFSAPATSTQPFIHVTGAPPAGSAPPLSATWRVSQDGTGFDAGTFHKQPDGSFGADVPVRQGTTTVQAVVDDAAGVAALYGRGVTVNEFTYSFAEGATGGFFDTDIALANPTGTDAPVTFNFLPEGGLPVSITGTVKKLEPLTTSVDPLVPDAAVSTVVHSTDAVPLAAERTMIWDSTGYGGHGGSAAAPATRWLFAEGSQGYFSTFILLANDNTTDTAVTLRFLREDGAVVTQVTTVPAKHRQTIYAGDIPALVNQSFGTEITSALPIIAERAMYLPGPRIFEGGHESAGVNETNTHWFLAEGATGSFFDCFVLLSNPNDSPAHVTLTYLLPSGETIPQTMVVPANGRRTINIATVDPKLASADVSTTVASDLGVVAERAMYWPGGGAGWREGHNSFGITETGLHWGLADGRLGGPRAYQTYILMANPSPFPAEVQVRFLKPGTTVTRTYTVNPHSRQNIWVNGEASELGDGTFGVDVQVLNYQPIVVEKALYWNSGAEVFAGGTNVTATRLPPP